MQYICKEHQGFRLSLEEHRNECLLYVYRNDEFLTDVVVDKECIVQVLTNVKQVLEQRDLFEDCIVLRDIITELNVVK